MPAETLRPRMHPLRHQDDKVRTPKLPRTGGAKRSHPSWRGRYVHAPKYGTRAARVVVKTSWIPKGKRGFRSMSGATAAHVRYLQHDHTQGQEREPDVYTKDQDQLGVEGRDAFAARTHDDGWQWRIVVSPEQGKDIDLTRLTRDFIQKMEQDTGYRLDWVAANHTNTGHPHSHIIVRGNDLDGAEVGLKRDYICRGMPSRARDLATEQLDRQRTLDHEHMRDRAGTQDYEQGLDRG